jgi:histidine triad (HIT) family protein
LARAIQVGQKVIKHATKVLGCEGYNVLQNNGEVAGQTIFHFHLHLIPRYADMDNDVILKCPAGEMQADAIKELTAKLAM